MSSKFKKTKWWKKRQLKKKNIQRFYHNLKRKSKRYQVNKHKIKGPSNKLTGNNKIPGEKLHIAPKIFSLIKNADETLDYFSRLRNDFRMKKPCFIDVSEVVDITIETLTLLCAFVKDEHITTGVSWRGNLPNDQKLKKVFTSSGFLNHMHTTPALRKQINNSTNNSLIHIQTDKKADAKISAKVSLSGLKYLYGKNYSSKHINLGKILVEMMANTVNHASPNSEKEEYNWWFLVYDDDESHSARFCFLDLGVGIFETLPKMVKQKRIIMDLKGTDVENIKSIFEGNYRTKTQKKERGRGLYTIYNTVKNAPDIKNFTMISNKVFAIIEKDKEDDIKEIRNNFKGTLYTWELVRVDK